MHTSSNITTREDKQGKWKYVFHLLCSYTLLQWLIQSDSKPSVMQKKHFYLNYCLFLIHIFKMHFFHKYQNQSKWLTPALNIS
jgi:hypothetical protein